MTAVRSRHFADELITRTRRLGHPLCVGLDPHLSRVPTSFRRGSMRAPDPETAEAVEDFLGAVVERLEGRVAIVKPQIALFEQLGWRGLRVLERVVRSARERGLLVLLDAKRGDIGSTAEGYARAYLEPESPTPVDALTVNPYLGLDTLEPYTARAEAHGNGVFVLVKTSNPGSGDLQDRDCAGVALFERVAQSLAELAAPLEGPATGFSSLGVVVGATYPEQAQRVRAALPNALFLVPGYGEQGASAKDAVRGFCAGPQQREGGIVASSRAILYPPAGTSGGAAAWEAAFDEALRAAVSELREAVHQ